MSSAPGTRSPLLVAELFYIILDFLAEPSHSQPPYSDFRIRVRAPDPDGRRALAALARTCRGFLEPSLNRLWCKLNSLEPLIRSFTPWTAVLSGRQALRPPSGAQWLIINRYSHRIRELEVQNDTSCVFLQGVIFEPNLLPNLKVLKWKTRADLNPIGIAYIQPLLAPGLVTLDVGAAEYDIALASFLQACPSRCPGLVTARFHIYGRGWGLVDGFSEALCRFKNLKCLALAAPVNGDALQHILRSSELQELTLRILPSMLRECFLPPPDIPLRNLKKLELTLNDLRLIIELLRAGGQSLCEIKLHLYRVELATSTSSLFSRLATHPLKSSLRSLHLDSTKPIPHLKDCNLFILSFDTFQPLTVLTNLRELSIHLANPIILNDEELAGLARNWPLLQGLELCYDHHSHSPDKDITFKGLLSLVAICPELRVVGLTLDGRNVPDDVEAGLGYESITALRFPNSPIDDPHLVAKFLSAYFPSVTSIGISETYRWELGSVTDKHGKSWVEVGGYLADAARMQFPPMVCG